MKIKYVVSFILVLAMAGCGPKKKKAEPDRKEKKTAMTKVNIPLADNTVRSFFDEDIGEFVIPDNLEAQNHEVSAVIDSHDSLIPGEYDQEFAWAYEENNEEDKELDTVYFNFDEYDIQSDQEDAINNNINHLCKLIHKAQCEGDAPEIVIEGHSCKITRSNDYNFALSETRAKTVADRLIAAGIPEENIKVVGRGSEYWIVEDGSIEQQAPNRRVEIHIKSKNYPRA